MTDEDFLRLVDEGLAALPKQVQALMKNVAVVIEDEITNEKLQEMGFETGDVVFGLYEGIPLTERGVDYQALPDKITIYKQPILAVYSDPEEIRQCVENTVWHEVAHHFGYGEEWLEREEDRRGKTQ